MLRVSFLRRATSGAMTLSAISIAGYIGMVGALIVLLAMRAVFCSNFIVAAVQIVAFLLLTWARLTFGLRSFHVATTTTDGGLVTTGPYRYIRHPIYTGFCIFGWAGIAAHWSLPTFLCGMFLTLCALVRIFLEEKLVQARYPQYAEYAATTWRMIPCVF